MAWLEDSIIAGNNEYATDKKYLPRRSKCNYGTIKPEKYEKEIYYDFAKPPGDNYFGIFSKIFGTILALPSLPFTLILLIFSYIETGFEYLFYFRQCKTLKYKNGRKEWGGYQFYNRFLYSLICSLIGMAIYVICAKLTCICFFPDDEAFSNIAPYMAVFIGIIVFQFPKEIYKKPGKTKYYLYPKDDTYPMHCPTPTELEKLDQNDKHFSFLYKNAFYRDFVAKRKYVEFYFKFLENKYRCIWGRAEKPVTFLRYIRNPKGYVYTEDTVYEMIKPKDLF